MIGIKVDLQNTNKSDIIYRYENEIEILKNEIIFLREEMREKNNLIRSIIQYRILHTITCKLQTLASGEF